MGMSSPKTKAEAREQIAKLQGEIASQKAQLAYHKSTYKDGHARSVQANMAQDIASKQAKIAKLRSQIPSLPK